MGEAIDRYIASVTNVLSPTTILEYESERRTRFQSMMGVRLCDLTNDIIQNAINKDAEKVSPKTIRNGFSLVSKVLKKYHKDLVIDVTLPAKVKTDITLPSDEHIKLALKRAEGKDMYTAILLAAFLGLRRSEICALTQDDVDYENSMIRVNKTMLKTKKELDGNKFVIKHKTKTYLSTRYVEAPPILINHLTKENRTNGRLVRMNPDSVTKEWARIREACGFHCRFHDLRHYTASIMKAVGMPDKNAMEVMGHATRNMLDRVYQHPLQSVRDKKMGQLHKYIEETFDED